MIQQRVGGCWIDHATCSAARGHDPEGKSALLREIRTRHRQTRREDQSSTQSIANRLTQENRVKFVFEQRRKTNTENLQHNPSNKTMPKVARVSGTARKHASKEDEKHLNAANPTHGAGRMAQCLGVVLLKDAVAVCHANGVEEDHVAEEDV